MALLSMRRTHPGGRVSLLMIVCRSFDRARSTVWLSVGPWRVQSGTRRGHSGRTPPYGSRRRERMVGRSGRELERRRRGPRRGHPRQPYALQIGPDRGRIGQGGDDPQAPATGCACAEVGAKHPGQQSRPPQSMGAGRSARIDVRRRRLLNRFGGHDAAAVAGPGGQDPVVAQEMKPGRGDQSRQLLQQFHRREQEMASPIRPRRFERKAKPLRSEEAQAPRGQGWSGYVAA